ncbi:MAG: aminopeptidase [Actinomycetota bacterium]|nr:aminopeptidase [Actinomycetota bacterium]
MRDQRIDKVADILVEYSMGIKKGELVQIRGPYVAEPLILAIYERCLKAGAYVILRPTIPQAEPIFFNTAGDEQLEFLWPVEQWLMDNLDASFGIIAATNTRQLTNVDPARQILASKARKPLMDTYMKRTAAGDYRWNLTMFPTDALAMEAEMSLSEYEELFFAACFVDADDPVAEWRKLAQHHQKLIDWMKGRKEVHLEGEGTDLYLDVTDRVFIPADGQMNFPDGEIFTGPVEDGTHGHITYSYPGIYGGQAVEGIQLTFEAGKVVEATARRNEEFLIKTLDTDAGSRVLGELGIGTNYGVTTFTGEILLDEKIGGTVHLAVGASYPETGGKNDSAVHWDMVCDLRRGGRITVDGDVLMEDGKFLV